MLHSKKKIRELFRFFERLSFLIFIKVSEPVRLTESLEREGLQKTNSRANEALYGFRAPPKSSVLLFTKMYLEKNKTALCKNLFFMKILRYTYCKLIK